MGRFRRKSNRKQHATLIMIFLILLAGTVVGLFWKGAEAIRSFTGKNIDYDKIIREAAQRNQVDPRLLKAVIWRESRFDPMREGNAGEIGLMQIMPDQAVVDWAKAKGTDVPVRAALFDPELNIEIGSWYLGKALRRWKAYRDCEILALCEYNAGYQRAASWKPKNPEDSVQDRINIRSTQVYVRNILKKRKEYAQELRKSK
jgi:soluble lytic murein transglycosylase